MNELEQLVVRHRAALARWGGEVQLLPGLGAEEIDSLEDSLMLNLHPSVRDLLSLVGGCRGAERDSAGVFPGGGQFRFLRPDEILEEQLHLSQARAIIPMDWRPYMVPVLKSYDTRFIGVDSRHPSDDSYGTVVDFEPVEGLARPAGSLRDWLAMHLSEFEDRLAGVRKITWLEPLELTMGDLEWVAAVCASKPGLEPQIVKIAYALQLQSDRPERARRTVEMKVSRRDVATLQDRYGDYAFRLYR